MATTPEPITSLPRELRTLRMFCSCYFPDLDFIPRNLQYLYIQAGSSGGSIQNLPPTMQFLTLSTLDNQTPFPIVNLPPNLTSLSLYGNYSPTGLGNLLPPTLKFLYLTGKFSSKLDSIPPNLTDLCIGKEFNHPLPKLPLTLRVLKLYGETNVGKLPLPPRLFHISTNKKLTKNVPETCHHHHEYLEDFFCTICDEFRMLGGFNLMDGNDSDWISAVFKGLFFV